MEQVEFELVCSAIPGNNTENTGKIWKCSQRQWSSQLYPFYSRYRAKL